MILVELEVSVYPKVQDGSRNIGVSKLPEYEADRTVYVMGVGTPVVSIATHLSVTLPVRVIRHDQWRVAENGLG